MVLSINDAETLALAQRLATMTGESLTKTVKHALQLRLEQVESLQKTARSLEHLDQDDPRSEELQRNKNRSAEQTTTNSRWSEAEKAVRNALSSVAEKIPDAASSAAGNARSGAARVRDGAKGASAWVAEKAREGAATGLSVTQSYGAPVVTEAAACVHAVSEKVRTTDSYRKVLGVVRDPTTFWNSYSDLSRFKSNLDWSNVDPTKYLFAGGRGKSRSLVEAQKVWETIPEPIRAAGPEATAKYLEDKDWSHIRAYSEGGSDLASNGVFEDASVNRARGSARMTQEELQAAKQVLQQDAFHATLLETARSAMEGALSVAAISGVMAVFEYGLQFQRGEISENELYRAIGKTVLVAGISGAAVSGLVVAMTMAFPTTIPVVSALAVPLMVISFSVLGMRLARVGKGWYEVYLSEQPLRPLALQYWLMGYANAVADYVGVLPQRRLTQVAES